MLKRVLVICALALLFITSAFAGGIDDFTFKIQNNVKEEGYKFYAYLTTRYDPIIGPVNINESVGGHKVTNDGSQCNCYIEFQICKLKGRPGLNWCAGDDIIAEGRVVKKYTGTYKTPCDDKDKPSDGAFYLDRQSVREGYSVQHFIANAAKDAEYLITINK